MYRSNRVGGPRSPSRGKFETNIYSIELSVDTQTICDSGDGWEGGVNSPLSVINPTPSVADTMEDQDLRRAS